MARADARSLTYQQLLKLSDNPDLVVVDLRSTTEDATRIGALLPDTRVVAPLGYQRVDRQARSRERTPEGLPERAVPRWLKSQPLREGAFYVLIDDGDGLESEVVARRMAGRGLTRVFVLAGGERALKSRGESVQVTRTVGGGVK
jgi:rhodanese-related sulfurtransferase